MPALTALGVTKVNDVGVTLLMVIGFPANVAVVSRVPKSTPVTVTVCPPVSGPSDGFSAVSVGPASVRSVK